MQISDDGMDHKDLAVTLGIGLVAMMRGGRLTTRQKRILDRRVRNAHARVNKANDDR
ncbi:hypothetical protein [Streptomyces sp. cg35]|uniref:hypothetical protein n=1 Tax=Streptomyces sp. cg35 TaxID=3421650 RepID=UPI003D162873